MWTHDGPDEGRRRVDVRRRSDLDHCEDAFKGEQREARRHIENRLEHSKRTGAPPTPQGEVGKSTASTSSIRGSEKTPRTRRPEDGRPTLPAGRKRTPQRPETRGGTGEPLGAEQALASARPPRPPFATCPAGSNVRRSAFPRRWLSSPGFVPALRTRTCGFPCVKLEGVENDFLVDRRRTGGPRPRRARAEQPFAALHLEQSRSLVRPRRTL